VQNRCLLPTRKNARVSLTSLLKKLKTLVNTCSPHIFMNTGKNITYSDFKKMSKKDVSQIVELTTLQEIALTNAALAELKERSENRQKAIVKNLVTNQKSINIFVEKLGEVVQNLKRMGDDVEVLNERSKRIEKFIDGMCEGKGDKMMNHFLNNGDYLCEIGRLDERIFDMNIRIDTALRRCERNKNNVETLQAWLKRKHC